MKITKIDGLGSYGVYIDGVDFNHITDDEWMEIGKLHLQNLVTIIRDCNMTWEQQSDYVKMFGDSRHLHAYNLFKKYNINDWEKLTKMAISDDPILDETDKEDILNGARVRQFNSKGKHVARVTGKLDKDGNPTGMFASGELLWHSNEGGNLAFAPGVALLGAKGMVGSSTGFLTTPDYYENVSESFRSELDEMILTHRFTAGKINPGLLAEQDQMVHANMCPVDDVEIPMVIQSPGGIKGLHYSINTVYGIKGLSKKESDKVFNEINKELVTDKYIFDHWYKTDNDLLLFDNSITVHRRLGETKNRLAYRQQHDYSNLQDGFWQPYFQKEFADKYENDIVDIVKTTGVKGFKLPK